MRMIKRKRYYFSDSSIASDTVIAFVMGGISFAIELIGIVMSVISKGHIPGIFGMLYICAILLSAVGEVFAWIGNKAQEGGVKGKRISIALNIITFVIPVGIVLLGLIGAGGQ